MTDRELLELAAKAAGFTVQPKGRTDGNFLVLGGDYGDLIWSPLTDDGDALRLAVKLGIQLHIEGREESRAVWANDTMLWAEGDELGATRRAIVRAAAQIGKALP
jgi:hypothetical protein